MKTYEIELQRLKGISHTSGLIEAQIDAAVLPLARARDADGTATTMLRMTEATARVLQALLKTQLAELDKRKATASGDASGSRWRQGRVVTDSQDPAAVGSRLLAVSVTASSRCAEEGLYAGDESTTVGTHPRSSCALGADPLPWALLLPHFRSIRWPS